MHKKSIHLFICLVVSALIVSCSSAPKSQPEKAEIKPVETAAPGYTMVIQNGNKTTKYKCDDFNHGKPDQLRNMFHGGFKDSLDQEPKFDFLSNSNTEGIAITEIAGIKINDEHKWKMFVNGVERPTYLHDSEMVKPGTEILFQLK